MKITIGQRASYISLKDVKGEDVAYTQEIAPSTYADYDENGLLLGIEFLGTPELIEEK